MFSWEVRDEGRRGKRDGRVLDVSGGAVVGRRGRDRVSGDGVPGGPDRVDGGRDGADGGLRGLRGGQVVAGRQLGRVFRHELPGRQVLLETGLDD